MFLFLLLIIFIIFIIGPIIRIAMMYYRLKKRANDFFNQQNGQKYDGYQPFGRSTRQEYPQQNKRHKKIDPSIGEYVDFEELPPQPANEKPLTDFTPENQIEDAEWTDIK